MTTHPFGVALKSDSKVPRGRAFVHAARTVQLPPANLAAAYRRLSAQLVSAFGIARDEIGSRSLDSWPLVQFLKICLGYFIGRELVSRNAPAIFIKIVTRAASSRRGK